MFEPCAWLRFNPWIANVFVQKCMCQSKAKPASFCCESFKYFRATAFFFLFSLQTQLWSSASPLDYLSPSLFFWLGREKQCCDVAIDVGGHERKKLSKARLTCRHCCILWWNSALRIFKVNRELHFQVRELFPQRVHRGHVSPCKVGSWLVRICVTLCDSHHPSRGYRAIHRSKLWPI